MTRCVRAARCKISGCRARLESYSGPAETRALARSQPSLNAACATPTARMNRTSQSAIHDALLAMRASADTALAADHRVRMLKSNSGNAADATRYAPRTCSAADTRDETRDLLGREIGFYLGRPAGGNGTTRNGTCYHSTVGHRQVG